MRLKKNSLNLLTVFHFSHQYIKKTASGISTSKSVHPIFNIIILLNEISFFKDTYNFSHQQKNKKCLEFYLGNIRSKFQNEKLQCWQLIDARLPFPKPEVLQFPFKKIHWFPSFMHKECITRESLKISN